MRALAAPLAGRAGRLDALVAGTSKTRLLVLLYLVALGVSLAVGFAISYRSGAEVLDYDEWEYWRLSSDLLAGSFDDPGRRTAGFPLVVAALRLLIDDIRFVQIALTMLAALSVPLLALAMLRCGADRTAALLGGLALALWPPHVFLATSLYSESLALVALLLLFIAMPRTASPLAKALWWCLVSGLLLGVLAHIRTMYQLLLPVLLLVLLLQGWKLRDALAGWFAIAVGFALVVLPWSLYVSERTGTPTLLTANGGETLAGGLNPNLFEKEGKVLELERRSTWVGPGKWIEAGQTGYLSQTERELPYAEQDRLLRTRVTAWVVANPHDAAYLSWRKLAYMWAGYPWAHQDVRGLWLGSVPIVMLLALFLTALAVNPRLVPRYARFVILPVFVSGIALISWGSWRFRHPADAAMLAVVAVAAIQWLRAWASRWPEREP
jgi:hypothetical protein